MQLTVHGKNKHGHALQKCSLMLATLLFLTPLIIYGQQFSFSFRKTPLEEVFRQIEKKTQYRFVFTRELIDDAPPVTMEVNSNNIDTVLNRLLDGSALDYSINQKYVSIFKKEETKKITPTPAGITVGGRVLNEHGEGLAGVSVIVKQTALATATDESGRFVLEDVSNNSVLLISSIGYKSREIAVKGRARIEILLETAVSMLDETVVIAYGTTTKRLNTGSVSKVGAEEISKQPVSNPIAALEGRVPGLVVTQSTGYGGSAFTIQLRGQNSLLQGFNPLFIIDGVPFSAGNNALNQINNATELSPFYTINPADIESIEVLKDADATAIYGSRGANGVVLITTKKGRAGKTKINFNAYSGWSKVTRTMDMLDTRQYVEMRHEAHRNDSVAPTAANAPDIMVWDTTRFTDFKKMLIGGTAHTNDVGLSVSGGQGQTQFMLGGGYHRETTVLPTDLADSRASAHLSLNHSLPNKKLIVSFKSIYSNSKINLPTRDPGAIITMPPNMKLFDSAGKLNWEEGGVRFKDIGFGPSVHPLAVLQTKYAGEYQHLSNNLQVGLELAKGLQLNANFGYNLVLGDEVRVHPSASLDPFDSDLPYAFFGNQTRKGWIIEPQLNYTRKAGKGKLAVLAGATWQQDINKGGVTDASNYTSDLLINSVAGAGKVVVNNNFDEYKYTALFGRINYNLSDKYILNLSGRRDGSSRFGPENRFNNFGAAGMAWIFSKETAVQKLSFLSFGKLRASYGITGNDQIPNYRFQDTWTSAASTYQQEPILLPTDLFNPVLGWESSRKFEVALELGAFEDRIFFSTAFFRNLCGNQLVNYKLPIQTGFSSVVKNIDALIENRGLEFMLQSQNIMGEGLKWSTAINLSIVRNKLLEFPNLETSSYANNYVIGEPLSVRQLYLSLGVDEGTGVYNFFDADKNGLLNADDRIVFKNTEPKFYGGLQNSLSYKGLEADIFFEFRKQEGLNYIGNLLLVPGYRFFNQPGIVLNRWQRAGDVTDIQKFTASTSADAYKAAKSYLALSTATFGDASYIRCKTLSISYTIPTKNMGFKPEKLRVFVQAQNLFTITSFKGADPENQKVNALPLLKTITGGVQIIL